MITLRKSGERGKNKISWLESYHSFSFADYYDPAHMGFYSLLVINEDYVAPLSGFAPHGHKDMEIITYVLDGAVAHEDSTGSKGIIRHGEVQRMTAGSGIRHSEINPSDSETLHLLQIWIVPEREGLTPGYEQISVTDEMEKGALRLVASRDGREGSLTIHQDAELYAGILEAKNSVQHAFKSGRHGWVQVARGNVLLNDITLQAGDGAAISEEDAIRITAKDKAELLLFDLAA